MTAEEAAAAALSVYENLPDGRYVGIIRMAFTDRLVVGTEAWAYDDCWCYHRGDAHVAMAFWLLTGCTGEPTGWHRHPTSGRRRPEGDPAREYVNH